MPWEWSSRQDAHIWEVWRPAFRSGRGPRAECRGRVGWLGVRRAGGSVCDRDRDADKNKHHDDQRKKRRDQPVAVRLRAPHAA